MTLNLDPKNDPILTPKLRPIQTARKRTFWSSRSTARKRTFWESKKSGIFRGSDKEGFTVDGTATSLRRRTVGFLNCVPGNHISTPYMRNDKNDPTIPVKNDIKGVKILILVSFRESWRDD